MRVGAEAGAAVGAETGERLGVESCGGTESLLEARELAYAAVDDSSELASNAATEARKAVTAEISELSLAELVADPRMEASTSLTVSPRSREPDNLLNVRHMFVSLFFGFAAAQIGVIAYEVVRAGMQQTHWTTVMPAFLHLALVTAFVTTSWVGWSRTAKSAAKPLNHICSEQYYLLLVDTTIVMAFVVMARFVEVAEVSLPMSKSDYWLEPPSAVPESRGAVVVFVLYFVWDVVHDWIPARRQIKTDDDLKGVSPALESAKAFPTTCGVSLAATLFALLIYVFCGPRQDAFAVSATDAALISLVVLFRTAKVFENRFAELLGLEESTRMRLIKEVKVGGAREPRDERRSLCALIVLVICVFAGRTFDLNQHVFPSDHALQRVRAETRDCSGFWTVARDHNERSWLVGCTEYDPDSATVERRLYQYDARFDAVSELETRPVKDTNVAD